MSSVTDWRLESTVASIPAAQIVSSSLTNQSASEFSHPDVAPKTTESLPVASRNEVPSMYSPLSIAFFGMTGTAVGAAGFTGNFGGLTSLIVTLTTLCVLFVSVLAARSVARRRVGR
jgi:hypothetical protein